MYELIKYLIVLHKITEYNTLISIKKNYFRTSQYCICTYPNLYYCYMCICKKYIVKKCQNVYKQNITIINNKHNISEEEIMKLKSTINTLLYFGFKHYKTPFLIYT